MSLYVTTGNKATLFPERDLPISVNTTLKEGRSLNVTITETGLVLDAYDGNEIVGTIARTFDEVFEETR